MNKEQSTKLESNIPYQQVESTSIQASSKPSDVTYKDVVKVLQQFLENNDRGYDGRAFADRGIVKNLPNKLKIQTLLQGLNEIIMDCINMENKSMSLQHSVIVSDYFNGMSKMSSIIDNIDIKVADDKLLCYIIAYMTKLLNNHERYQNKL